MKEVGNSVHSVGTKLYKAVARPILFSYKDPEESHDAAAAMLKGHLPMRIISRHSDFGKKELSFKLGGKVQLDGPLGIAAGFDKNGTMLKGLSNIFDYVTFGTVLPYEWPGNPKKSPDNPSTARVVRLEDEEAMLNCLGFPFGGLEGLLQNVSAYDGSVPLNASVAVRPPKEGETMDAVIKQFEDMAEKLAVHAPQKIKMVEANFASPNTKGLAVFYDEGILEQLTGILVDKFRRNGTLLFLKMPPHLDDESRSRNLGVAKRWINSGGDGLTVINAVRVSDQRLSMGGGGKSGKPIYEIMLRNLSDYRLEFEGTTLINAVGGITPERAPQVLMDGRADTVQVLTHFIYHGPLYVRDAKTILLRAMKQRGFGTMEEVRDYNRS